MVDERHPDGEDVDAIFESIVARWDEPSAERIDPPAEGPTDGVRRERMQSTGDVDVPTSTRSNPGPTREEWFPDAVPWRVDPTNSVADALLGAEADPGVADDDEGFTPPPPAPLPPASDRLFWGAVVGLVLGPLGLVWIMLTDSGGFWSTTLSIGLFVGGFACLVMRQPTDRSDETDNGARV